jgi:hypothetical protein
MLRLINSLLASAAAAMQNPWPSLDTPSFHLGNWRPGGAPGAARRGKARWKHLRRTRGG